MIRSTLRSSGMALGVALACALSGSSADAGQVTTYYLNQSNTFADGLFYGEVKIDITGNVASFTVDPYNTVMGGSTTLYTAGTNFGLQTFAFNVVQPTSAYTISALPSGWGVQPGNGSQSEFGKFLFQYSGTGNSRQDPLTFKVTYNGAGTLSNTNFEVAANGSGDNDFFFAAHLAGFSSGILDDKGKEITSHFVAGSTTVGPTPAAVPEPSTFLSGLLAVGVAGFARLRMRGRKAVAA